jgi:hypothetical protein
MVHEYFQMWGPKAKRVEVEARGERLLMSTGEKRLVGLRKSSQSSLAWQSGPLSAAVLYDNYNRRPVLAENWPSFWKADNSNRVHDFIQLSLGRLL